MWKKIRKEDAMKLKLEVRVNLTKVDSDQPMMKVCVATKNQRVRKLEGKCKEKEISPT